MRIWNTADGIIAFEEPLAAASGSLTVTGLDPAATYNTRIVPAQSIALAAVGVNLELALSGAWDGFTSSFNASWESLVGFFLNPVDSLINTVDGMAFLWNAIFSDGQERSKLYDIIQQEISKVMAAFSGGDSYEIGKFLGSILFEIMLTLMTVGGGAIALDTLRTLQKTGKIAELLAAAANNSKTVAVIRDEVAALGANLLRLKSYLALKPDAVFEVIDETIDNGDRITVRTVDGIITDIPKSELTPVLAH